MQAIFYNFSKRTNSLLTPDNGTPINVVLKDGTSLLNPILELHFDSKPEYNYCRIADFGRYYYINDWRYERGLWYASLTVDPLASWKSEINNTLAMIGYTTMGNDLITDSRFLYAPEYEESYSASSAEIFNQISGVFVIGVTPGTGSQANGLLTTYALSWIQMQQLSARLSTDSIIQQLKDLFTNPYECIVFCNWLPLLDTTFGDSYTEIFVGGVGLGVNGILFGSKTYHNTVSVPIPWGNLVDNSYRCAPYTTLSLYLPFVGVVGLSANILHAESSIDIELSIDLADGAIAYRLKYANTEHTIATYGGSSGASIPISRSQGNISGLIGGAVAVIGGAAAVVSGGASLVAGVGAMAGGLAAGAKSAEIHTQVNGSLSSRAASGFDTFIRIYRITYKTDFGFKDLVLGKPLFKADYIRNYQGYIQTIDASVQAAATDTELNTINAVLNSGIYTD